MTQPKSRARVHYVLAGIWLVYTLSLAVWWLSVGMTMTERRSMFLMEGATFIIVLVAGGLALIAGIRREHARRQALEMFFMAFTHDLKTSLASVALQAEGLREDWPETADRGTLDRLLQDTVRLQIQLENSLFVAQPDGRLLTERIDVPAAFARLAQDWPQLAITVAGNATVAADARAFDTVVRNLLQNAVIHGPASQVTVAVDHLAAGTIRLTIEDNGAGAPVDMLAVLGQSIAQHGHARGTGVGLYVCRLLLHRMKGALSFLPSAGAGRGLRVVVDLPEAS